MLYDPKKWTKADPLLLETLIAWLETRQGRYEYACHDGCMLASYFRDHGYPGAELGSHTWHPYGLRGPQLKLSEHFRIIALDRPHSYQGALKRARALLDNDRKKPAA